MRDAGFFHDKIFYRKLWSLAFPIALQSLMLATVAAMDALMLGYLAWFQVTQSRDVINNPYNARLETFEENVVRGSILAADGQILAYTRVEADGAEIKFCKI